MVKRYDVDGCAPWFEADDGGFVDYEDYASIEAKCAELAAEKEKFAVECAATKIAIAYMKSGRQDFTLNTPATDAFLAEVRAQGVDAAIEHLHKLFGSTDNIGEPIRSLEWLAKAFRKGAAQ